MNPLEIYREAIMQAQRRTIDIPPKVTLYPGQGGEPSAEELAAIEARKASVRAAKEAEDHGMGPTSKRYTGPGVGNHSRIDAIDAVAVTVAATPKPAAPPTPIPAPKVAACPECGKAYGQRQRCYACQPGRTPGPKSPAIRTRPAPEPVPKPAPTTIPSVTPPTPPVITRPTPSPMLAEIDALRRVAEILASLDVATGERVIGWFAGRIDPNTPMKG